MTWYAVSLRPDKAGVSDEDACANWTLSQSPDVPGWETDGGYDGYGLTKEKAEHIAGVLNDHERLTELLRLMEHGRPEWEHGPAKGKAA